MDLVRRGVPWVKQIADPVLKVLRLHIHLMPNDVQEEQLLAIHNAQRHPGVQGPTAVCRRPVHEELAAEHHSRHKENKGVVLGSEDGSSIRQPSLELLLEAQQVQEADDDDGV